MNRQQLKQKLETEYNLVCFEDFADVSASPFHVYNLLYHLHKTSYQPNERLVFYSKDTPSDNLIQHLYRAAEVIDVSEFFILLYDSIDDAKSLHDKFTLPNTLCPMPWMNAEVWKGQVRPCCVYTDTFYDSFADSSLEEIFKSDAFEYARKQLLTGNKIRQCNACWDMEDLGITSHRQRHLSLYQREFLGNYIQQPKITSLDLKPSNACNFKCRICGPEASSLHASEMNKQNIIVKQSDYKVDKLFDQELPHLLHNLTNIDFYGGEPFFIKQILKFVQHCVDNGHSEHLRLHFNTNGSVYPEQIESCWQHFKHIDIQFSIDDMGKRFELQRGGKWQEVEANIHRFIDLNLPNMSLNIMPAISIMNIFYIDELFEWADNLGLAVYPIMVEKPEEFCFDELTQQAKDAILNKYKNSKHPEIQKFYNVISKVVVKPDAGQQFKNKIEYYDSIRNESFQTSHYEIAQLMGMC